MKGGERGSGAVRRRCPAGGRLIERAPDPVAALASLGDKVDDEVISRLAELSYVAWRDGDHAASRFWADLAVRASLLGGTSSGRAER